MPLVVCPTTHKHKHKHRPHQQVITRDTFQSRVLDSEEPAFIEFYAPWCGHCQKLMPRMEKVRGTGLLLPYEYLLLLVLLL